MNPQAPSQKQKRIPAVKAIIELDTSIAAPIHQFSTMIEQAKQAIYDYLLKSAQLLDNQAAR